MQAEKKPLRKIDIKRDILRDISNKAIEFRTLAYKEAMDKGEQEKALFFDLMNVNQAIHYFIYKNVELRTFYEWKQEGYTVKKGSKALLFWGQPIKASHFDDNDDEKKYKFFPIAFVFKKSDVVKPEKNTANA